MGNELSSRVVGYARVSTRDQDLTSQVERVQKYRDGASIKTLATEYQVSMNTIRKRLELRGVQIRSWKA